MTKFILYTLVFLSALNLDNFKTGSFEYEQIINKGHGNYIENYILKISNDLSEYQQRYIETDNNSTYEEIDNSLTETKNIKQTKSEMKLIHNNFSNSKIFFKDIVALKKVYIVEDEKLKLNWKLSNETKNFGKRKCKKATLNFRGRNYTAWYLEDIQVKTGPWKFISPPGLIFEIYDNDKILHIKLKNINLKVSNFDYLWKQEKIKKIINLNEYKKLKLNEEQEILDQFNSRRPKGSKPFKKCEDCGFTKEIEIFI